MLELLCRWAARCPVRVIRTAIKRLRLQFYSRKENSKMRSAPPRLGPSQKSAIFRDISAKEAQISAILVQSLALHLHRFQALAGKKAFSALRCDLFLTAAKNQALDYQ